MLQAGTAVLVDAYGVPRVKCNCGNPLTAPTPVTTTPSYTGTRWPGFSPTTVVVVNEVTVRIDVYVLVDVVTGEPFSRPVGTTGAADGDAQLTEDRATTTTTPTTSPPPSTSPSAGDVSLFCSRWQGYLERYAQIDPTVPEIVNLFEDLTSIAPADIRPQMETLLAAVRQAAARGESEISDSDYPGTLDAVAAVIAYLSGTCHIDVSAY